MWTIENIEAKWSTQKSSNMAKEHEAYTVAKIHERKVMIGEVKANITRKIEDRARRDKKDNDKDKGEATVKKDREIKIIWGGTIYIAKTEKK
ncbi:conserved hypothetical protein [Ricinus communis]|uniref:Uncharacterized protein n=1 Tax=Ricinus communis TaxID=3988 RepID=B9T653_RICCO|nr:conserved hypothetical protein [Ricinus communis]